MALTNRQRVEDGLDALKDGLEPFLKTVITTKYNENAWKYAIEGADRFRTKSDNIDLTRLFSVFHEYRDDVKEILSPQSLNMIHESQQVRNAWAHQETFDTADTLRALDTIGRVLQDIQQPDLAGKIRASHSQLLREMFAKQAHNDARKHVTSIKSQADAALSPWRDVVMPHEDVRTGRLKEAEFAADLDEVHRGKAGPEYQNPEEFFSRTFLTEGLTTLLTTALQRLHGVGGDPVVELQTNFGGGKTHSMIALYHIASGIEPASIPALEGLVNELGLTDPLFVQRAVLVGTTLSVDQPRDKGNGVVVRTLWGELAWQLAGERGYQLVAQSDKSGLTPGKQVLQELFELAGPSLILIDEWVAFVRHLYYTGDTPPAAGSFDANLTFVHALTEAVSASPQVLLAASLPSSEIEVGGEGGRYALERLKHTFSRVKSTWRAATGNEGFEIVRRRLFQDVRDPRKRDATILMYQRLYQDGRAQFPTKVQGVDYKNRMEAAYPFHPELFDMLFGVWGSLDTFQRTRGVLRLMANVVHTLWARDDASPLIMPATIPLDAAGVVTEIGGYLPDSWSSVIEHDIDGDHALSLTIDRENPNFDKVSATRRVARTVFMGSAPTFRSDNRGIDDKEIRLGVVQPGESPSIFGDALRTLADKATYLYSEHGRYWFSTQASVIQQAQERLANLPQDDVDYAIVDLLRGQQSQRGVFDRVHVASNGSGDIVDTPEVTLVLLGPGYAHVRNRMDIAGGNASDAIRAAESFLNTRGEGRRQHRNALIFLAADNGKLVDLRKSVADHIVWSAIVESSEQLNLDAQQLRQARSRQDEAARAVQVRLRDTWSWLIAPWSDPDPGAPVQWEARQLKSSSETEGLAVAASKRARSEEIVVDQLAGTMLRRWIERIPQFSDGWTHIQLRDLAAWFANYLYLQRVQTEKVIENAVRDGLRSTRWDEDTFAYADEWDEDERRYLGLTLGHNRDVMINLHGTAVLVHPHIAKRQFDEDERRRREAEQAKDAEYTPGENGSVAPAGIAEPTAAEVVHGGPDAGAADAPARQARRYFGTVTLNPQTLASQVTEISREVVAHLSSIYGAEVTVSLEIEATVPDGVPENVRETVEGRAKDLRFDQSDFVEE